MWRLKWSKGRDDSRFRQFSERYFDFRAWECRSSGHVQLYSHGFLRTLHAFSTNSRPKVCRNNLEYFVALKIRKFFFKHLLQTSDQSVDFFLPGCDLAPAGPYYTGKNQTTQSINQLLTCSIKLFTLAVRYQSHHYSRSSVSKSPLSTQLKPWRKIRIFIGFKKPNSVVILLIGTTVSDSPLMNRPSCKIFRLIKFADRCCLIVWPFASSWWFLHFGNFKKESQKEENRARNFTESKSESINQSIDQDRSEFTGFD